jgi:hypothetical protein
LDAGLRLQAAEAWLAEKNFKAATRALDRALKLDPRASEDERAARVLLLTAQQRPSSQAAFALLEGPMGARGAEVIWDLAADEHAEPWVRQRAGSWLRKPVFRQVASPALALAADLRTALSCESALALLPKAKDFGDKRSLPQLQAWTRTTGCGPAKKGDCMACLRTSSALADAIAAVSARQPRL